MFCIQMHSAGLKSLVYNPFFFSVNQMKTLLAIDTSNAFVSVAVANGDSFFARTLPVVNGHSEETLPLIQALLLEAGLTLSALEGVIYGHGPGAFTGLRIGCGIAQGLALASALKVIPVPTLDIIAFQSDCLDVMVAMDARMGEVYTAVYRGGVRDTVIGLSALSAIVVPDDIAVLAGDCVDQLPVADVTLCPLRPDAAAYIRLVRQGGYVAVPPEEAGLLYIRDKVALTAQEQHARRHG